MMSSAMKRSPQQPFCCFNNLITRFGLAGSRPLCGPYIGGRPVAGKRHADKYGGSTPSRQRGERGSPSPLPSSLFPFESALFRVNAIPKNLELWYNVYTSAIQTERWEMVMAKTAVISARIDPELKQKAEQIFRELGLTASQAIVLFYRQVDLQRGLPFSIRIPNAVTRQALEDARLRRDLESFDSVEALFEDLRTDENNQAHDAVQEGRQADEETRQ